MLERVTNKYDVTLGQQFCEVETIFIDVQPTNDEPKHFYMGDWNVSQKNIPNKILTEPGLFGEKYFILWTKPLQKLCIATV